MTCLAIPYENEEGLTETKQIGRVNNNKLMQPSFLLARPLGYWTTRGEKKEAPAGNVSKAGSLKGPIVTVATGSLHQLE